ncbi:MULTISPECIES: hypothetical protein [Salinibaculum]|uniref:hypothetical protein n=1 Tax=Salinibaculum TaxID=2732368 RepID=UPI0030D44386
MTGSESDWPDDPAEGGLPSPLLLVLAGTLAVQTVLMVWSLAADNSTVAAPSFLPTLVLALSGVAALAVVIDARSAGGWWQPRWPFWVFGVALLGVNVGVAAAYILRRQESVTTPGPTARWKLATVSAAGVAAVSTMVYEGLFDGPEGLLASLLAVVSLGTVGFGLAANVFDLRYVTSRLDGTGTGWVMDGYHWPIMVMVLIPANVLFAVLYLYRRRRLFTKAGQADTASGVAETGPDPAGSGESPDDVE